ncbi:organic cation transporter protein-like isoform X2 [Hyposmocoma kahamanoa]|uniref:organic cation transporter protein-like isoform X2 n=1 Tax=Hyposmocoma kahamanoa TaxID=1477025 RepID=UPI000E6D9F58|nr:organic cation transporter protein-like isoform X2 [Hyposmocoma kahamanoa]
MMNAEKVEDGPGPGQAQPAIDLDYILVEEVGQFGKYQLTTLLLAAVPVIFAAFASGEYIFTTARIPSRCRIPQCDGETPEFRPSWLLNAINGTSLNSFDNCAKFANSTQQHPAPPGTCPNTLFDTSRIVDCEAYVYENTLSVVYDFDMACDEWRRSQIGSFVNSYEWFLALEVIESTVGAGAFSSCYILVMELVGPKYRVPAGAMISTMFAVGQVLLGFIAWGVPSWRALTRLLYAPQLLVVTYFWILSESIRWLMSKGRYEESETILKKVAKVNKKQLSEKSLEALRTSAEVEKTREKVKEPWLVVKVFKSKLILFRCIVSPVWWITNTLVYYGMNINAVNLSGNRYLNYVYVAAIEIPGFWTAVLLLDRVGRKPVLICGYWLCATCQFAFAFLPEGYEGLSLTLYLIGKFSIAMVMTSVYLFTAELFPTKYRHTLLAFASMIGRVGSITAPLTPAFAQEVWEPFPSVLFGSFALLSGLLIFTMPETWRRKLPDTFEEAEALSRR